MPALDLRPKTVTVHSMVGADIVFSVAVLEADEVTPINITGYVFTMSVETKSGVVLQNLTIGSGITIINAPNGLLKISIEGNNLVFPGNCAVIVYGTFWATNTLSVRIPYVQFVFNLSPNKAI